MVYVNTNKKYLTLPLGNANAKALGGGRRPEQRSGAKRSGEIISICLLYRLLISWWVYAIVRCLNICLLCKQLFIVVSIKQVFMIYKHLFRFYRVMHASHALEHGRHLYTFLCWRGQLEGLDFQQVPKVKIRKKLLWRNG